MYDLKLEDSKFKFFIMLFVFGALVYFGCSAIGCMLNPKAEVSTVMVKNAY